MERLISLWKALANISGTYGANLVDWGSLLGQLGEPEVILSPPNAKNLSSASSTIDSWGVPMAIINDKWVLDSFMPDNRDVFNSENMQSALEHQMKAAQAQQQANSFLNQQLLGQAQQTQQPPPKDIRGQTNERALHLLMMRLSGVRGQLRLGKDDFMCCHVREDTVHVFFVLNGRSGNTEEHVDIFPSDKLLTQLRLIMS